ncbi:peptide ABC transporter substrate-binding protein [Changpingibacter yushuensis]|uniref:peptide ABC transporter substrate-binding protein n=1 Tax=Changpingibacter yushuensis TaxID=2758440 RepID=UPI00165D48AD|nr:ABC transporter substrate-binding protein [Changpingibacter yushuensis]
MKFKRSLLAVPAALALALSACSSGTASDDNSSADASSTAGASTGIVTANGSEPQNPLIPANTNETGGGRIVDLLFAGLVYYDAEGATHNEMAESIETDDSQNYTIKIKEGQKFSDGTEVQAHNFVDAWKLAVSEAQLSAYFFEPIEGYSDEAGSELTGLTVVDDYTFTVALNQPESDFPQRLGYSAFFPLPDSTLADTENGGEHPVGNGPYMLASDDAWEHNVQIQLVPNPEYQGDRAAQNGGVTIVFYAQQDAAYADLTAGNLDVLDAIPDSALSTFEDELGDRAVNQPSAVFQSFTIPQSLPHFSGEEGQLRREAISLSINRDQITDTIFSGTRTPAVDFTSPVVDGFNDSLEGSDILTYDTERAADLWAQADAISPWEGTFAIAYNSDGGHQTWVDAVTNSIKNTLGIDAEGAPYPDFASLRTEVTDRTITTAFRTGWQADYPGLYNFLAPIYATGAGSNDGDYSNPEFDSLLSQAAAASDADTANGLLDQAQEILLTDLPAIPLWYSNVTGGFGESVDNVVFGWNSVPLYYAVTKN